MSEKLCTLRTKGGGGKKYTETSLWTNPSPSSNFAAQTVTLSDSIDKYKYIKIRYAYSATSQLDTQKYEDIRTVETFKKGTYPQTDYIPLIELGVYAGNIATARGVMYASDTTVRFSPANNIAQTGTADNRAIPLEILGLNELDHAKGFDESVLWTNSAPTSSFAKQDVTLSDDINNYDYLKFTYRVTTSVADFLNYIISVSDFKKSVENSSIQNCVLALSTDDSVAHTRRIYYKTDTTVNFNNSYQLNAVASNNATVIPTSIVGCKFR